MMYLLLQNPLKGGPTMNFPNTPLDFTRNSIARKHDALDRVAVDLLGGEPLEGSGFEGETPAPDFAFDWTLPKDQIEGGLQ
jgi:hypothetical protein